MTFRTARVAMVYAAFGSYWIISRHALLFPDTSSYARGRACWSSTVSCVTGGVAGVGGLELLGVMGAAAVGVVVASAVGSRWAYLGVFVPPMMWAIGSVDALAASLAALACWGIGRRENTATAIAAAAAVAIFHLEAGLVVAVVELGARHVRVPRPVAGALSGILAMAAVAAVGRARGVGPD
ncbi:MAG: hypothetical protein H0X39_06260, partial [Actinobacteria bacterium]|nr:hypothetical protein [Actinomycetota bacterium]